MLKAIWTTRKGFDFNGESFRIFDDYLGTGVEEYILGGRYHSYQNHRCRQYNLYRSQLKKVGAVENIVIYYFVSGFYLYGKQGLI